MARQTWEMRRVVGKVHREVVRADFFGCAESDTACLKWLAGSTVIFLETLRK